MKSSQWKPIVLFSCCVVAEMGNKNSVWVLLKRATTPTHLHLPPLSLTHPRTIYFQLPLPTNKKCQPTPIYPKYISTNPHSPRIYLHPPTPTPPTKKCPFTLTHPKYKAPCLQYILLNTFGQIYLKYEIYL